MGKIIMAKISMMELLSLQQGMTEPQKAMFRNQLQQRQKNRGLTFILALFLGGVIVSILDRSVWGF